MSELVQLRQIIDWDLQKLLSLTLENGLAQAPSVVELYARIKIGFLGGKTVAKSEISLHAGQSVAKDYLEFFYNFNELLSQIQLRQVQHCLLNLLSESVSRLPELKGAIGEIYNYVGIGWLQLNQFEKAAFYFREAESEIRIQKAFRLLVTVQYNALYCRSLINSDLNLTTELSFLSQQAQKYNNHNVAAVIESRLAEQFIDLGDFETALVHADKSIESLEKRTLGRDYYLARLNRAYIHLQLSNEKSALAEVKDVMIAPYSEVIIIAATLKSVLLKLPVEVSLVSKLNLKWRSRFDKLINKKTSSTGLSPIQFRVIKNIMERPVNKYDLIESVYQSKENVLALENRLKNVLNKINKKFPDMVRCQRGHYFIENKSQAEFLLNNLR